MRKLSNKCIILLIICCLAIIYMYYKLNLLRDSQKSQTLIYLRKEYRKLTLSEKVVLSFVVCNARFNESINLVKSVLLFTKNPVHFVIFTDESLQTKFKVILNKWGDITNKHLTFELHQINFPEAHREDWINLFSKCAAQRLFIPKLLPHIDSMIYVDTDTLFLGPAEELWYQFSLFNQSQMSGMALEDDNPNVSWYPRFAKHPFYGKYGLNSGVMLMNLTRMRSFGWVDYVTPIMLKWKLNIPWGDQDIINIIFHYHERAMYVLSCRFNYRSDQCMYGDACPEATTNGVFLLHGSRGAFHNNKQPAFQAVYQAINEYELETDTIELLLANIKKYVNNASESYCGSLKDSLLKVSTNILKNAYTKPER